MPAEKLETKEKATARINAFADLSPKVEVEVTAEHGILVTGHPPLKKGDVAHIDVAIAQVLLDEGSVKPAE